MISAAIIPRTYVNNTPDSLPPDLDLEVSQNVEVEVLAKKFWNAIGIGVEHGERYELVAVGEWVDWQYRCSAAGYALPNWLLRNFEGVRRVSNQP